MGEGRRAGGQVADEKKESGARRHRFEGEGIGTGV